MAYFLNYDAPTDYLRVNTVRQPDAFHVISVLDFVYGMEDGKSVSCPFESVDLNRIDSPTAKQAIAAAVDEFQDQGYLFE